LERYQPQLISGIDMMYGNGFINYLSFVKANFSICRIENNNKMTVPELPLTLSLTNESLEPGM
jgi:hypothetical protein